MIMSRRELGKEILQNMEVSKEQYVNFCSLVDELGLEKGPLKCELPKEDEWSKIDSSFGTII